ncbi:MAG: transposase [Pseudomonadota bacterium]
MPRAPRIHVPGGIYHATLRGNHAQDIFRRDNERTLLNTIVGRTIEKHRAKVHAFCWMTNHLHLLVQVDAIPLGRVMQQIASEYARAFQRSLETTGHLFEARYYATLIDTDAYLLEALRYVHQNPVRAGLARNASQYRWSSHGAYLGGDCEPWVTTDLALALFSGDRARASALYRAFVDDLPAAEIAEELASLDKGVPILGRDDFIAKYVPAAVATVSLGSIVAEACRHFTVTVPELRSPLRISRLVAARAWITLTATRKGVATISAIARELQRDESTLRSAMRRHCEDEPEQMLTATKSRSGDQ